jgi:ATP-dependent DNA helicase RecQ
VTSLSSLLKSTFGFDGFRANQEAVCRAATDGRDVLLVMPTGAGKSLCYQLPAIARGGTGLVVSPLIALMDDQAHKLTAAGLKVGRIHSGLSREDSRQACRDYLDGTLQFLFIAPERMRVPGFPEMLAKRKPALIAIDEAHCISAWGHDFRPDYRMLGEYLPALRPAPIIALTATATPTVQADIVKQLGLEQPKLFIHGFRRENLSIEVMELSKPQRMQFTADFLGDKTRRPAIVYAPSRKAAEELAGELGRKFPAAAYHAGLDPGTRERVQTQFQSGRLECVVATIAFGMGIDKADVRTVVHYALPASVEAYYQEIGRAGRDGQPSRTVLLWSYADRKMHDFFLERDYPVATELMRVAKVLTEEFQDPEALCQRLKMDRETFGRSVEKLAAQGAAAIDFDGNVRRLGNAAWQSGYEQQVEFRRSQIDRMMGFATTQQCRMTALIRHFGDTADGTKPCGHCDFCSPESVTAQSFAEPTKAQERDLRAILRALAECGGTKATGRLFTELALTKERGEFEALLDGLARAGLISIAQETFLNGEGKVIPFKKASLTHEGREMGAGDSLGVVLRTVGEPAKGGRKVRKSPVIKSGTLGTQSVPELTTEQKGLEEQLRAWRKAEAAKTGKPAFLVFSDAALRAVVVSCPRTVVELGTVSGFGPDKVERYGAAVCAICRGASGVAPVMEARSAGTQAVGTAAGTHPTEGGWRERAKAEAEAARLATFRAEVAGKPARIVAARASSVPVQTNTPGLRSETWGAQSSGDPIASGVKEFRRERGMESDPTAELSEEQRALDERLRAWRKAESEKMGLPQFFVLGTSTLRSIVLERPKTLKQLQGIQGIGQEKLEKFGASILEVCNG